MARAFLDTSIFFYALDSRDPAKQALARSLIEELASSNQGVISVQVIQEFASNAIKKLGFSPENTLLLCEAFADHMIVRPDLKMIESGLRIMAQASLSFWDACIIAAAVEAKCHVIYSEDLATGQRIAGLTIRNPFT